MNVRMKKSRASQAAAPASPAASRPPIELPDGMWERIAEKAYEFWKARGRREGYALQDWIDAEQIVMDEIHEARE